MWVLREEQGVIKWGDHLLAHISCFLSLFAFFCNDVTCHLLKLESAHAVLWHVCTCNPVRNPGGGHYYLCFTER